MPRTGPSIGYMQGEEVTCKVKAVILLEAAFRSLADSRLLVSMPVSHRRHTLTWRSQPADTMSGLLTTGEKRTQDTHSVWPSGSPMVYLHSPSVFHSLIVLSRAPDTICARTSAAHKRSEKCSFASAVPAMITIFHTLTLLSRNTGKRLRANSR